jgi:hypothetical protein
MKSPSSASAPAPRAPGPKSPTLSQILSSLKSRGKESVASALLKRVSASFPEASEQELFSLTADELSLALHLSGLFAKVLPHLSPPKPKPGDRMSELRRMGFSVTPGEKFA